jgi:hypothetical protein
MDSLTCPAMECHVKNADFARDARSHTLDDEDMITLEEGERFTPGQFFKEAGTIVAVCLGLGLLVQIVLG